MYKRQFLTKVLFWFSIDIARAGSSAIKVEVSE